MTPNEAFVFLELPIQTATLEALRKQYKKLALKYHPDKGGSAEKFRKLTAAHDLAKESIKKEINLAANALNPEQQKILIALNNAIFLYMCHARHYYHVKKVHGTKTCSASQMSSLHNRLEAFEYESLNPQLNELLIHYADHLNKFIRDRDVHTLERNYAETFRQNTYDCSRPLSIEVYDCSIFVLRAFFRFFDYIFTFVLRNQQLIAETSNSFAKACVGRDHFFTYSTEKPKPSQALQDLDAAFHTAIQQLQEPLDPRSSDNILSIQNK